FAFARDDKMSLGNGGDDSFCGTQEHRDVFDRVAEIGDECDEFYAIACWQAEIFANFLPARASRGKSIQLDAVVNHVYFTCGYRAFDLMLADGDGIGDDRIGAAKSDFFEEFLRPRTHPAGLAFGRDPNMNTGQRCSSQAENIRVKIVGVNNIDLVFFKILRAVADLGYKIGVVK